MRLMVSQIQIAEHVGQCFAAKGQEALHIAPDKEPVHHIWHVDGNAHDTPEWKNNLYLFSQRIFR